MRSMRVTGRCDQKFAPRSEWSAVIRISVSGDSSRREGSTPSTLGIRENSHLVEDAANIVGEDHREIVCLEQGYSALDRLELRVHDLDAVHRHAALAKTFDHELGGRSSGPAPRVIILFHDDVIQPRCQAADGAD